MPAASHTLCLAEIAGAFTSGPGPPRPAPKSSHAATGHRVEGDVADYSGWIAFSRSTASTYCSTSAVITSRVDRTSFIMPTT